MEAEVGRHACSLGQDGAQCDACTSGRHYLLRVGRAAQFDADQLGLSEGLVGVGRYGDHLTCSPGQRYDVPGATVPAERTPPPRPARSTGSPRTSSRRSPRRCSTRRASDSPLRRDHDRRIAPMAASCESAHGAQTDRLHQPNCYRAGSGSFVTSGSAPVIENALN